MWPAFCSRVGNASRAPRRRVDVPGFGGHLSFDKTVFTRPWSRADRHVGFEVRGPRPAPASCRHGPKQRGSGLLRWRERGVRTRQTFPEALPPGLPPPCPGSRPQPQSIVPIARAEIPVSAGRGEAPGWSPARWSLCRFVAGPVRSSEPRAPHWEAGALRRWPSWRRLPPGRPIARLQLHFAAA